ncbi:hypothetical protein SHELI_v1c03170 [Spiroplasma helicoides]|uniref:Uncharacterized protein n=1 Tax=Spiroplasma helicoides TaxID=216938 RepID=A0A1B3SK17_9MOLU|nr:hypothetical protein [Spiroplasma helicoides]AOG60272.1 hypothetical protein SHELI_v1c03170 [Spiroplasma helicoides]
MYISIERNTRGHLEIEEKVLNKIIELSVKNNTQGLKNVTASISMHHEKTLFIILKMELENKESLSVDEVRLTNIINELMSRTILIKPKNIAFAYTKV